MKVAALVLGDVGRSPRMQYSALSLSKQRKISEVHLIGYQGASCFPAISQNPKITVHRILPPFSNFLSPAFYAVYIPIRIIQQILQLLFFLLFVLPACDYVVLQNPPSIPTFLMALTVKAFKGSRIVIDWHNLSHTLLDQKFGSDKSRIQKTIIWLVKWHDLFFSRFADFHFTVTERLKEYLGKNSKVPLNKINVVYDRPNSTFKPLSVSKKHTLFYKLADVLFNSDFTLREDEIDIMETPFTLVEETKEDSEIAKISLKQLIKERPFFIISSTSYTPDEDFNLLLDALFQVDKKLDSAGYAVKSFPDILCVVTGKGPLKSYFEEKIKHLQLLHVSIKQLWIASEDYASLLSCADLGISLHTSSSGLDLPMKIVDMFGAGIPVCAARYKCIEELVTPNINGIIFNSSNQLAEQIYRFIEEHDKPKEDKLLYKLKKGVHYERKNTWEMEWDKKASIVFEKHDRISYCSWTLLCSIFVAIIALRFLAVYAKV